VHRRWLADHADTALRGFQLRPQHELDHDGCELTFDRVVRTSNTIGENAPQVRAPPLGSWLAVSRRGRQRAHTGCPSSPPHST
jgi:hypothetical protein